MVNSCRVKTKSTLPKAERVRRDIEARIRSGKYAKGELLPPERALSEEFGVSRPTLRKALVPLSAAGLLASIPGSGTRVLGTESAMPVAGWKVIALVVPDMTSRFFIEVASAIEHAALQRGYQLLLCSSRRQVEREDLHLNELAKRRVDGVILVHDHYREFPKGRTAVERAGIPCVWMFSAPAKSESDTVVLDEPEGVQQALRYLFSLGHQRIAFWRPLPEGDTHPREHAWREAMRKAGTAIPSGYAIPYERLDDVAGTLAAIPRPTAILSGNDHVALVLLRELARAGIRVPGDISVIGYDNLSFSGHLAIPLTTVDQPKAEMGRRAAELLFDRIEVGIRGRARHEVFEPRLVIRESCGVAPQASHVA